MARLSALASRIAMWLSVAGLVAMTAIIGWQVFARYVLNSSPSWTEQAALLLMLWFILFAAAAGVREGFHIRLSLLQDSMGTDKARFLRVLCNAIVLLFCIAMTINGVQLMIATWHHTIPSLGISRSTAYLPIAASGALSAFFAFEHILAEWQRQPVEPLWN